MAANSDDAQRYICRYVGQRLLLRRTDQAKSPQQLSDALGIPLAHYLAIEAGLQQADPLLLGKSASVLGCCVSWFFEGMSANVLDVNEDTAAGKPIDFARERFKRGCSS